MIDSSAFDQLFLKARTYRGPARAWQDRPIEESVLRQLWQLTALGPTAANNSPARIVFVRSPEAKAKLRDALDAGNVEQTMAAPVTAIIGMDLDFHHKLPVLFPHTDARSWYEGDAAGRRVHALRNSSLQGGYFILAARALGLDCGPMGGFDAARIDAAFFAGTSITANFLCNLGYGNPETLHPRNPRLGFDEACRID